ncbi:GspH/FimT family pseudopilin [Pseudomonas sp. RIT-PI-S]|uniref:GspH/FimT family pseudopilin n=1 Tax=Pseudomonas sp. RIT-PI-S TaxID=3035295 RepID=UPI0021D819C7|nr:GspH/FimT family pseudopilin [Pseudomonas sp. RIT-PI-S]
MRQGIKGFSLIELLITVAVMVIAVTVVIPSFSGLIARNRADADMAEIARALGYARLEAINRGQRVRILPVPGQLWAGQLEVMVMNTNSDIVRMLPALSGSAALGVTANSATPANIEFNSLGALASAYPVTFAYTKGNEARSLLVCVNGRVALNGAC